MLSIAGYTITSLVTEYFALDGGAMFGSIPRVLWERSIAPDSQHRIPLCCRSLYLQGHGLEILVDLGSGLAWDEKFKSQFAIESKIPGSLSKLFPNLSHVVLTHAHFDHAGGILELTPDGNEELTFPNASYYLPQANWERANAPGVRERASYVTKVTKALSTCALVLLPDKASPLPGISFNLSYGHTSGLAWITITDETTTLAFPSDLIPTAHHLHIPFVMGYDLHAETTMTEKQAFLEQAVRENWIVVFEHDRDTAAGRIKIDQRGRFELSERIALDRVF